MKTDTASNSYQSMIVCWLLPSIPFEKILLTIVGEERLLGTGHFEQEGIFILSQLLAITRDLGLSPKRLPLNIASCDKLGVQLYRGLTITRDLANQSNISK